MQFDFSNEEGKPYKSSGGEMVWNEKHKRYVPYGWEYKCIKEIEPNIVTGKTPPTSNENIFDGGIPFITIDDIRKSLFVYSTARTLSKIGADSQSNKYISKGSLCCSCIGTTGIIGFVGKRGQTNQQINTIIFKHDFDKEYLRYSLEQFFTFAKAKVGNILPNMNKEEFSSIQVLYPNEEILKKFHLRLSSLYEKIDNSIQINLALSKQRDELLPLLMNGQVSVNCDLSLKTKNIIIYAYIAKSTRVCQNRHALKFAL